MLDHFGKYSIYLDGHSHPGMDNGKPGDRGPGYYAAYVIDADGNNIEASFRS